ncbi:hypothetical protein KQI89_08655 [Clostridium sp. MSJ-4]|uniref:Uncharacterized protein n=1 Tax=Clostridium simiarum TaxID=2841506 RepID=A0ABS6F0C3_9CLOT|nr:hypothetical protein [Clostridium simiarum]MBU5591835.1 hypothetical protein [Clostridium simiarum]
MFEYKFKCNGTNAILNIENNYIRIGEKEIKLKSCELKSRKKYIIK